MSDARTPDEIFQEQVVPHPSDTPEIDLDEVKRANATIDKVAAAIEHAGDDEDDAVDGIAEMAAEAGDDEPRPTLVLHLDRFEGPLDLLLHLIKRDEVDVYDIPIARITEQYLAYLDIMRSLDLEVAGEYLVMASTLVRIKARLLLPSQQEEEEEDPRDQLVQRLLEYRQFKDAAEELRGREDRRRALVARGLVPTPEGEAQVELVPVSLFKLLDVVAEVLSRRREEFFHRVERERVSVEETMKRLLSRVKPTGKVLFRDVLMDCEDRVEMVTVVIGMLELARMGEVKIVQDALFGDIWVFDPATAAIELDTGLEEVAEEAADDTPAPSAFAFTADAAVAELTAAPHDDDDDDSTPTAAPLASGEETV